MVRRTVVHRHHLLMLHNLQKPLLLPQQLQMASWYACSLSSL